MFAVEIEGKVYFECEDLQFVAKDVKEFLDGFIWLDNGEYELDRSQAKTLMGCSDMEGGGVVVNGGDVEVFIDGTSIGKILSISGEIQVMEFCEVTREGERARCVWYQRGQEMPEWLNDRMTKKYEGKI